MAMAYADITLREFVSPARVAGEPATGGEHV
jgi:hypothetical protein